MPFQDTWHFTQAFNDIVLDRLLPTEYVGLNERIKLLLIQLLFFAELGESKDLLVLPVLFKFILDLVDVVKMKSDWNRRKMKDLQAYLKLELI